LIPFPASKDPFAGMKIIAAVAQAADDSGLIVDEGPFNLRAVEPLPNRWPDDQGSCRVWRACVMDDADDGRPAVLLEGMDCVGAEGLASMRAATGMRFVSREFIGGFVAKYRVELPSVRPVSFFPVRT
jgi:hypothetical protein